MKTYGVLKIGDKKCLAIQNDAHSYTFVDTMNFSEWITYFNLGVTKTIEVKDGEYIFTKLSEHDQKELDERLEDMEYVKNHLRAATENYLYRELRGDKTSFSWSREKSLCCR